MKDSLAGELGHIGRKLCAIAEEAAKCEGREMRDILKAPQNSCNQVGTASNADHEHILKELFTYHAPNPGQQKQYETIRDAALHLARVILKNTPAGADRTAAIRKLRESVMTANGAIALNGLSL